MVGACLLLRLLAGVEAVAATAARIAPRAESLLESRSDFSSPVVIPPADTAEASDAKPTPKQKSSASTSWSGAVLAGDGDSKRRYHSATGTFVVPEPRCIYYPGLVDTGSLSEPDPAIDDWCGASVWVGIDGDVCKSAILQGGITVWGTPEGRRVYAGWWEWWSKDDPRPEATVFKGFDVSAGHHIRVTITANSTTAGTVAIDNLTTGRSVSKYVAHGLSALCQTNADWVVEDFQLAKAKKPVPLAAFSTVTFTNASATDTAGKVYSPQGDGIMYIRQDDVVFTHAEIVAPHHNVRISYIKP